MSDNPKLRKNGGKGTFFGNLLRGALSIGKTLSPNVIGLIASATGLDSTGQISNALKADSNFSEVELTFLLRQLEADKVEMQEVTKRWEADMNSDSWLSKNVRPATLWLYNVAIILFIFLDSYSDGFTVDKMWLTILIANSGMINTAYFGSRYLEKRDSKRYK